MNEVYFGLFEEGEPVSVIGVYPPAEVPLPEGDGDWVAAGNALAAYPVLAERMNAVCTHSCRKSCRRRLPWPASPHRACCAGEGLDAADAVPVLRDKVALTVAERLAQGARHERRAGPAYRDAADERERSR